MKRLLAATAGILALTMTAACGSSSGGTSGESKDGRYDGQKLSVWIMEGTNPDSTAFFNDVKSGFKAKTGADVDIQMVPWSAAKDKFTAAIAGNTTPDVAEVGATWTPEFADAGALADLTDKAKQAKLDSDLVPAMQEAGTMDGKLYGVPWYVGIRSVVYNKEIFDKAGISTPPKNWAELTQAVDKIKQTQPDVTPFPVPGNSEFSTIPWLWGAGGDLATKDGDKWKSGLDSPKSIEGLQYWTDLSTKHNSSTPAAATWKETDVLKAYEQGKVGMILTGSWTPTKIKKEAPEVYSKSGAFPIPGKDSGYAPSAVGGSHLSVFNSTKNEGLSFEFVKYMTTGDMATKWAKESNYFPGTQTGLKEYTSSDDPMVKPFALQMTQGGKTVPVTPLYGKVQGKQVITTMTQSVLSGKADPNAAATQAAKDMNAVFEGK